MIEPFSFPNLKFRSLKWMRTKNSLSLIFPSSRPLNKVFEYRIFQLLLLLRMTKSTATITYCILCYNNSQPPAVCRKRELLEKGPHCLNCLQKDQKKKYIIVLESNWGSSFRILETLNFPFILFIDCCVCVRVHCMCNIRTMHYALCTVHCFSHCSTGGVHCWWIRSATCG